MFGMRTVLESEEKSRCLDGVTEDHKDKPGQFLIKRSDKELIT